MLRMQILISKTSSELDAIIQLRYEVLRKPWNKSIESATDEFEEQAINAYIAENKEVIACGRLQINSANIAQIRFMAVSNNHQGKGLGKQIAIALEKEALKLGVQKIELQARENAVVFYKTLGYEVVTKSHKLWDVIQHYLMEKKITTQVD